MAVSAGVSGSDLPYSVDVLASAGGGEPPFSYTWSFGASTQSAVYQYSSNGPQSVSVSAADCDGESGSTSFSFWGFTYGAFWVSPLNTMAVTSVRGSPHAFPTATQQQSLANGTFVVGEALSFNVTAESTNSTVATTNLTYDWTFGDGTTFVGPQDTVNHTYTAAGTYQVSVTASAPGGYSTNNSAMVIVSAQAPPLYALASLSYDPGPYPISVNFSSEGTTGGAAPYSYFWELGNGNTSSLGSPAQVYASQGTYNISLKVTDSGGNVSYSNITLLLQRYFSLTFSESGLPSGKTWSVDDVSAAAAPLFSSSSVIQFEVPNGTSFYSVGALPGYVASPPSGNVTIAGAAMNVAVQFSSTPVASISTSIPLGAYPFYASYNPGNGYVYVANDASNSTSILAGTTVVATVPVGDSPGYAVYDSANGYEYIINEGYYSPTGSVSILNNTTLVQTVPVGVEPFGAAYDAANGYVYVPNYGSNNVTVLSGSQQLGTVSVGQYPSFAAYDPANSYVYVPNEGTGTNSSVSVLSGTSVVGTIPVGIYPVFALYDPADGYVYVLNYNSTTVSVLDGLSLVATIPVTTGASWAVFDSNNGDVYVLHQGSNVVNVVNGTASIATITTGLDPTGAAYDAADGMVYVTNVGSNTVSVLVGTSVVATVAVGSYPEYDAYDPADGYVYVPNADSASVTALKAFTQYPTRFSVSGLPSGTRWSVTMNRETLFSTASTITFMEGNGTYAFTVGLVSGYGATPGSGSVVVSGGAQAVSVSMVSPVGAAVGALYAVYNSRADLESAFPNASLSGSSFARLTSWAAGVVTGQWSDSSYAALAPYGYYYALMGTYNGRADLEAAFPGAYTNWTSYVGLVNWAGAVVTGQFPDEAKPILSVFGYYYDLMGVYDGRVDLQSAFPNAFSNATSYRSLLDWAGEVVTGAFSDSASVTLASYGYYYALMMVYDGRGDLQVAYPNAGSDWASYVGLVSWAGAVVNRTVVDSAASELTPFGYYYALMWVYDGRGDLQAAYPTAFTDGGTYQELIDWARAVVLGQFSDSAYGTLYPFAASYEALG